MSSSNGVKAADRPESAVCNVEDCSAWKTGDLDFCHHHKGMASHGSVEHNDNAVSHGLHRDREAFLGNGGDGQQRWLDKYHAYHESLCSRYERRHGYLDYDIKDDLAELAFQRVKLDIAREYERKNAVDPEVPLTDEDEQLTEAGVFKKEQLSRVEKLQNNILRETRLSKKDMGLYDSPQQQQAEAEKSLVEVLKEDG